MGIGKIGEGKTRFYSPSNVSVSYAYSEMMHRDVNTAYDVNRNHNGGINYVYNNQAKAIEPFKQNKLLRKPALRLIGDFNFYYAPSQVSLSTTMDKRYSETLLRNLDNPSLIYRITSHNVCYTKLLRFRKTLLFFQVHLQYHSQHSLTNAASIFYSILVAFFPPH